MFNIPDISRPGIFVITIVIFFALIMGRYLLISGAFYGIFYIWRKDRWNAKKIATQPYKKGQLRREIGWSTLSALIFSIAGAFTLLWWQQGYTAIYTDIALYGWWYLPVSLIAAMLIHETYYYWTHRLMHAPRIYRIVHKVHHDSHTTSPFTAFSFHPLEAIIQSVALPLTLFILPMHPIVLLIQLVLMSFSSVINHLNIEIYPRDAHQHFAGKWIIGATHHSMHHKQYRYNFGLYFTIWDRLVKTESPSSAVPDSRQK